MLFNCIQTRTRFGIVGVFSFFSNDKVNRKIVGAVGPVADKAHTTISDEEGNAADDLCDAGWSKIGDDAAGSGVKEPASKFHRTNFIPSSLSFIIQRETMKMTSLLPPTELLLI